MISLIVLIALITLIALNALIDMIAKIVLHWDALSYNWLHLVSLWFQLVALGSVYLHFVTLS